MAHLDPWDAYAPFGGGSQSVCSCNIVRSAVLWPHIIATIDAFSLVTLGNFKQQLPKYHLLYPPGPRKENLDVLNQTLEQLPGGAALNMPSDLFTWTQTYLHETAPAFYDPHRSKVNSPASPYPS